MSTMLGACGKPRMNYYILDSQINLEEQTDEIQKQKNGPVLSLLPVNIPRYLDRPQIVFLRNDINMEFSENHRWGEDLNLGIERVLVDSLCRNLSSVSGIASPIRLGRANDYTLFVEVSQLEGERGDKVVLHAIWSLHRNRQNIWQSTFKKTLNVDLTYDDYVKKTSVLLNELGKNIAQDFLRIYKQRAGQ